MRSTPCILAAGILVAVGLAVGVLVGAAGTKAHGADGPPEYCGDRIPHPPIQIQPNTDPFPLGFVVGSNPATGEPLYRPGSGVVDGRGTADDPYVIEGWCIVRHPLLVDPYVTTAGIFIANTTAHVVVRDVTVDGVSAIPDQDIGIWVSGAENVTVAGSDVEENWDGVRIENSRDVEISNTRIVNNFDDGIDIEDSFRTDIKGNNLSKNTNAGVDLEDTTGARVTGNAFVENIDAQGVGIQSTIYLERTTGVEVTGNVILDTVYGDAVRLDSAVETTVANNTIEDSGEHGIVGFETRSTSIAWNNVTGHFDGGIHLEDPSSPDIRGNNIEANSDHGLHVVDNDDPVAATGNWWGAGSGPSGGVLDACSDTEADGSGQPIATENASVCFDPWRDAPNPGAGTR